MDIALLGILAVALFASIGLLGTALFQLRGEMRESGELRGELHSMSAELGLLRTEMIELRSDMNVELGKLRSEVAEMRGHLASRAADGHRHEVP